MLKLIDVFEEYKNTIITEKRLMNKLNLSYTELQNIPIRTLNIWLDEDIKESERIKFQQMVNKNGRNNY